MEQKKDYLELLELLNSPAFCGKDGKVLSVNSHAKGILIQPGNSLEQLISLGWEEYQNFSQGTLMLTITCFGQPRSASVSRIGQVDVFILEQDRWETELSALALASRELRDPLSSVMATLDRILPQAEAEDSARISRSLYRILRILGNMSDAGNYAHNSRQETMNIAAFLAELLEKAGASLIPAGVTVEYTGPDQAIYTLADPQQLERAVWNMLSNAVKFLPPQGKIQVSLARQDRMLRLTVQDNGSGIPQELLPGLFSRYLRQPMMEDSRHGIGLGMVLIRSAAANHGGTVLIDQPQEGGTRVTMTIAIRQSTEGLLRSPGLRVDYCGERDHALVELSESLPLDPYRE